MARQAGETMTEAVQGLALGAYVLVQVGGSLLLLYLLGRGLKR